MGIQESGENYLETILILKKKKGQVRSIDIANEMGISKPSVSFAMKKLRERGYIKMNNKGYITFTEKGQKTAEEIYEKHNLLTKYLKALGVSEEVAIEDACKIEHYISDESLSKIREDYKRIEETK
ncbi:MAG: metal-dependent transcriptional regulator [Clostridiales bacterium]|jgi:DtxR family Mn-dependent transcriptional regulator|nr:metal-dependent transcriptional regulator [Clostridiales bacterium]